MESFEGAHHRSNFPSMCLTEMATGFPASAPFARNTRDPGPKPGSPARGASIGKGEEKR
jgi:hypothetical protein